MKDATGEIAVENWDDKIQQENYSYHQILKGQKYEGEKFSLWSSKD